jgi:hypothetical protein
MSTKNNILVQASKMLPIISPLYRVAPLYSAVLQMLSKKWFQFAATPL